MKLLNRSAADVMKKNNIQGATDVTGFGLAGHTLKMAKASDVSISLNLSRLPLLPGAYRLTEEGCIPGASFRNLEFAGNDSCFENDLDYNLKMLAFDAQTSGGLIMCVPREDQDKVLSELHSAGLILSERIGHVSEKMDKHLYFS